MPSVREALMTVKEHQPVFDYREGERRIVYHDTIKENGYAEGSTSSHCPFCESDMTISTGFEINRDPRGVVHRDEVLECFECEKEYAIPGDF